MKKLLVVAALVAATSAVAGPQDPPEAASIGARYIVKFKEGRAPQATAALHAAGAHVALALPSVNAVAAYLPEAALNGMRNNPHVELVEEDVKRYPFVAGQATPWGIDKVQALQVVEATSGLTVCIIDSGYAVHDDLQATNVTGTNDTGTGAWNQDQCGHGTHVAGTIAALADTDGVVGVNRSGDLHLHIEKVFGGGADGCTWSYSSTLVEALRRCEAAGARVVSMSLGGSYASSTESAAFQAAYNRGVLSIAAAGNGGNSRTSYPAGYASVMSVAAVDEAGAKASFSQYNADVEIAAPGVDVLSTVPQASAHHGVSVGGVAAYGRVLTGGASTAGVTGALANGGLCSGTPAAGAYAGKVVLCTRGTSSFADKALHVKNGGGVAALITNNVPGLFTGTLNGSSTIPVLALRQADHAVLSAHVGASATVTSLASDPSFKYDFYNGTSMATPHVAGVAALVWAAAEQARGQTIPVADVRSALTSTAEDKGTAGRDAKFGYGIVRAKNAYDALAAAPPPPSCTAELCTGGADEDCDGTIDGNDTDCQTGQCTLLANGASCSANTQCCSGSCGGKKGAKTCR